MTILRDADSGKIIRSLSGEILKTPPIIDISSDYGVTKDGSNLVSKVKNRYQPNVFRAPIGNEPLEDDNGINFSGGKKQLIGLPFDYSKPFTIEIWFNTTGTIIQQRLLSIWDYPNDNLNYFYLQVNPTAADDLFLDFSVLSETAIIDVRNLGVNIFMAEDIWNHVLIYYDGLNISKFYNGMAAGCLGYKNDTAPASGNTIMTLGGLQNYGTRNYEGLLKTLKIGVLDSELFNSWDNEANFRKHLNGTQVFPPPTYPNTLL